MSRTRSIWSGVFTNWDEAASAASAINLDATTPYDSNRWIERQQSMLRAARSGVAPRLTNLPLVASVTGAHTIIDLGGGRAGPLKLYHEVIRRKSANTT